MITVGMDYEVREGKNQAFEDGFRKVLGVMADDPGHINSRLFRDIDNPRAYLIHSEWETREAFTRFIRSEAFAEVTRWGSEEILETRPRHKVYGE